MPPRRRLLRPPPRLLLFAKLGRISWPYMALILALAAVGWVALDSAAAGAPEVYANRHAWRFAAGLAMMLSIALLPPRILLRLAWPLYGLALALLALVLRMGHVGKGARRWLDLGGLQVQPSEMMKIALVLALAAWFHRAGWRRMGSPLFLLPPILTVLVPVALILKEPNLGTAAITGILGLAVFLAAGLRWWVVGGLGAVAGGAMPVAYRHLHDYQRARITTFLNPENDPLGAGYNIIQSRIALGAGGMWGKGFLRGTQGGLNFLPEKQTDFIFTMLGEQFGFAGGAAVMALLLAIVLGGMAIAIRCRNRFGRLVALGIATNFFLYCFVNIAMVTGAIPVGGVPLPLVSHGGSAMLTAMFGFGLLMSAHVHRDEAMREDEDRF